MHARIYDACVRFFAQIFTKKIWWSIPYNFFLLEIRLLRLQIENYKNEVEKHKSEAQQQKNRNVFLRNRLEEVTREKEELREGFNICHLGSNSGTAHRQH